MRGMMAPFLQLPRIHFDFGAAAALPFELERLGVSRPLFVTDANLFALGVFDEACAAMPDRAALVIFAGVPENPTAQAVESACHAYREARCDGIVAVGGGSAIDCAKAAALLATHPGRLGDYLGRSDRIVAELAPLVAIPTTAGTGSEVSRGCGIHPDASSRTLGLNSPFMVPRVAICDPGLTLKLPPRLTAGTGLDALTHCVEGFLAASDNPLVDAVALDGARRLVTFIERATHDGGDREARREVMLAAMQGGVAIYKGLGPAHAISNTCGDRGLHHGLMTTIALPAVLRLFERKGVERVRALAEPVGAAPGESAADAIERLNARLGVPRTIRALGYGQCDLDELAADAANSFFNRASPYKPTLDEYRALMQALVE